MREENQPMTIDDVLAVARARLRRLGPAEALEAVGSGALLVDTRPHCQRHADGEIPGAIIIERNHSNGVWTPPAPGGFPRPPTMTSPGWCSVTRVTHRPWPPFPCNSSASETPPTSSAASRPGKPPAFPSPLPPHPRAPAWPTRGSSSLIVGWARERMGPGPAGCHRRRHLGQSARWAGRMTWARRR